LIEISVAPRSGSENIRNAIKTSSFQRHTGGPPSGALPTLARSRLPAEGRGDQILATQRVAAVLDGVAELQQLGADR
jgi:hypothetical protein